MAQKFVSIVVLTSKWGERGKHLDECLQGIYRQSFRDFEIILVTNGLGESQVHSIRKKYDKLKIIKNEVNKGCATGRNQGIEQSRGNYIVTLDDDVIPDDSWLEELVTPALNDESVGMVASKILYSSRPDTIDSAGIEISKDGNAYHRKGLARNGGYEQSEEIFGPCGAAALYKRELFEDIGLFDEDYFIYYEDVDLAFRARLAGWQCLYVPQAIAFHHHSWSLGQESSQKIFFIERNKILTILKNWPIRAMLLYAPLIIGYDLMADGYYILLKKDFSRLRAKLSALRQLPRVLRERSKIHGNKKISAPTISKFLAAPYAPWVIYKRRCRLNHILCLTG
ncbi:MAG: hypothetical protein A3G93_16465 [Nitrospinae bacterium RIFCSPLOWO2_12_FULL_45_22]|nr:MAG: hypothetical protein A3G93_16465 [Nitrospinae bacterium RIFCSPLOWO2_12_FULL_45_22]